MINKTAGYYLIIGGHHNGEWILHHNPVPSEMHHKPTYSDGEEPETFVFRKGRYIYENLEWPAFILNGYEHYPVEQQVSIYDNSGKHIPLYPFVDSVVIDEPQ